MKKTRLTTGKKGLSSTEGRTGKRIPPGRDSLASVQAGQPNSKKRSAKQVLESFPSLQSTR